MSSTMHRRIKKSSKIPLKIHSNLFLRCNTIDFIQVNKRLCSVKFFLIMCMCALLMTNARFQVYSMMSSSSFFFRSNLRSHPFVVLFIIILLSYLYHINEYLARSWSHGNINTYCTTKQII